VKTWVLAAGERILLNIALYGGLVVIASVVVGVLSAVGGDQVLTGQDTRIVYAGGEVDTPNDDPSILFLFLVPVLGLFWASLAVPFVAGALIAAEIACALGLPEKVIRWLAVGLTLLLGLTAMANEGAVAILIGSAAMVAFAAMLLLPQTAPKSQPG
jgi:hypothetical protein